MNNIFSLWLIGPTAAGKTSVSKIIVSKLKSNLPNLIRVDGDEIRGIYDNKLGSNERLEVFYRRT